MALRFILQSENERTLARGFGVPIVKRAIIGANVAARQLEEAGRVGRNDGQFAPITVGAGDLEEGKSIFGTPLFSTLFIEKPKYSDYKYNDSTEAYDKTDVTLSETETRGDVQGCYLESCIVEINQPRNIITTAIQGHDGTVKEFINNGDYMVTIKGYFASENPEIYPEQQVKVLASYLNAPISLNVSNKYLNDMFGVLSIVVSNYSFKQVEGYRNVQYFTIEAMSDVPFEVLEINPNN
jgi:hypothetical protein